MNFFALDVETANADYSSICQIGIAQFKNGEIVQTWTQLINPETHFDFMNTMIHGIGEIDVEGCPTFKEYILQIEHILKGEFIVHHMPFDRTAINRACIKAEIPLLEVEWIDTARVARRTWNQFAKKGYGLSNLANFLNIQFEHHDALEDAMTAGKIFIKALEVNPNPLKEVQRLSTYNPPIRLEGVADGVLSGELVVFTGSLTSPRKEMAEMAASFGCDVKDRLTLKTTILVVGLQDQNKLNGHVKSSKHRKAEELIKNGHPIRIMSETDFLELANYL